MELFDGPARWPVAAGTSKNGGELLPAAIDEIAAIATRPADPNELSSPLGEDISNV